MFEIVGGLITLGATTVATGFGYMQARSFTRRKLRFVDAARSPMAPFIAGGAAAVVAAFPVALLPFVGAWTALLFGAGVGAGVASGKSDIEHHRLNP